VRGETVAFSRPTSGVTDPYDIIDHIKDRAGVQREDCWLLRHRTNGVLKLVRRNGTDMAEVLRQDEFWLSLSQELVLQPIESLS
jgi:hypothetical protein